MLGDALRALIAAVAGSRGDRRARQDEREGDRRLAGRGSREYLGPTSPLSAPARLMSSKARSRVALADLHAAHRVLDHAHVEPLRTGVDRRGAHAVVGGKAAYVHLGHVVLGEDPGQIGLLEA